ncbi:MAG: diaminopimelate epimerase [bacterium]
MKFQKWHGLGNDFVLVGDLEGKIKNPSFLSKKLCDRHFGIGADGLILILPGTKGDCQMRIFNPDGSEAEMCGNAIRCLAKYMNKKSIRVETLAGIIETKLKNNLVEVNMGEPKHLGNFGQITAISLGNPHAVLFVRNFDFNWQKKGQEIENNIKLFPKKTNVEFVKVIDKNNLEVKVWERGAGATLACGTGACAVAFASFLKKKTQNKVNVHLPGGKLKIEIKDNIYMTGSAKKIFEGEVKYD